MDRVLGTFLLRPYVFAFLGCFLAAAAADLGWRRTLVFTACLWPVAWLAEFSSTRTGVPFGLYHYTGATRGQELYIADVPFMDSLSFTFLGYAAFTLARAATRGRRLPWPALAVISGFLMMALDVVVDPLAVRGDRWFLGRIFYYPQGGPYFGVPLSNFVGWWFVGAVGVGAYLRLTRDERGAALGGRLWPGVALYYAVLAFNLVVTAWIGEWVLVGLGGAAHAALGLAVLGLRRAAAVGSRG